MTSNIHTLSSINRTPQSSHVSASSGQHSRIRTLSDLPSQSSNTEHNIESLALRHLQEARLSTQQALLSTQEANRKLDEVQTVANENSKMIKEALELARKVRLSEIDPNREYTPEEQEQLRQYQARAEETTRMLKALENEQNSSFISPVIDALKRLASAIDTVLKAAVRRAYNHQWKTAHKVVAVVLVTLGLGLAIGRFR